MQFKADMHIHSVLSPCGDIDMSPLAIVETAKARGMSVAGVVWNWCADAAPKIEADSLETIRRYLSRWGFSPAVVRVPRFDIGGPYPEVDFSEIFK